MNYAIILAGGVGSRFWPLSREEEPKQFLNLCSSRPMIEETIDRIRRLIPKNNIYIATNKIYHQKIKDCLKKMNISQRNLFFEPQARNTLAPIAKLTKNIYDKDKDSIILVLPCDHYIKNKSRFLKVLNKAISIAKRGHIVTLGITPDRPQTGYGYIKVKSKQKDFYAIDKFIEKPDCFRAKKFIEDRRYYWNAGIFIFRADIMLEEIKKFVPQDFKLIIKIRDKKSLNRLWPKISSISIDYAIMEKTHKIALIPADFDWTDLGSWQSVERLVKKDKSGNIFLGKCLDLGSKNTLAWSDKCLLATSGLDNIIIVVTKDAVLACAKDKAQDVKKIVQILKEKNLYKQI